MYSGENRRLVCLVTHIPPERSVLYRPPGSGSNVNALRAHLAEFGIVAAQGLSNVGKLLAIVADEEDDRVPALARAALSALAAQWRDLQARIKDIEGKVVAWHLADATSRRLATIPGVGPITASAIAATVSDPSCFRSGREFAAWLGLVPRQNLSGGKERLSGISKQGDRYLRRLLVIGATAVIRYAHSKTAADSRWLNRTSAPVSSSSIWSE